MFMLLSCSQHILRIQTQTTSLLNQRMKIIENKKEREDLYVLGNWLLAIAAITLDRVDYILLLGCRPLVRLERQARAFLHPCRHSLRTERAGYPAPSVCAGRDRCHHFRSDARATGKCWQASRLDRGGFHSFPC